MVVALLFIAFALLLVAAASAGALWRASPRARRRIHSEATGVPVATIDDYARERFARGTTPPPLAAQRPPIRPQLRALTPIAVDQLWDLSDR